MTSEASFSSFRWSGFSPQSWRIRRLRAVSMNLLYSLCFRKYFCNILLFHRLLKIAILFLVRFCCSFILRMVLTPAFFSFSSLWLEYSPSPFVLSIMGMKVWGDIFRILKMVCVFQLLQGNLILWTRIEIASWFSIAISGRNQFLFTLMGKLLLFFSFLGPTSNC